MLRRLLAVAVAVLTLATGADACTSMIVGAEASASGRPLLWKNRDTGHRHNFVERVVTSTPGRLRYVALFNAGDSLLREAWMGMNEAGFAIMNTASYNLSPDTARLKDREGLVMARALQVCRTVDDFASLLDTLPKPLGVQANFGVIDADGNGAYFETDDYRYKPYYLSDAPGHVLVRTNFSESGTCGEGLGRMRYDNVTHILADRLANGGFTPEDFTEVASRSFWNRLYGGDVEADVKRRTVADKDFIPRYITSASVVIEGVAPGQDPSEAVMWTLLGYPPTGHVEPVTIDCVPSDLRPLLPGWKSRASEESLHLCETKAFVRRKGQRRVNLDYIRREQPRQRELSRRGYERGRKK